MHRSSRRPAETEENDRGRRLRADARQQHPGDLPGITYCIHRESFSALPRVSCMTCRGLRVDQAYLFILLHHER